ncbi:hypothetical protein ACHWQZ_G004631 [Mnemiopsis leidyi]
METDDGESYDSDNPMQTKKKSNSISMNFNSMNGTSSQTDSESELIAHQQETNIEIDCSTDSGETESLLSEGVCPGELRSPLLQMTRSPSPETKRLPVPCQAVCPATLREPEIFEYENLKTAVKPERELNIIYKKPATLHVTKEKLVDPGTFDALDYIEILPLVKSGDKQMLQSENTLFTNYFNAVNVAHITKDYRQLEKLNERFKYSKREVNLPGENEWSPLQLAAALGDTEIVRLLCEHQEIDVTAADRDNDTALHAAAHWDHSEVIETILNAGSKHGYSIGHLINLHNNDNETPFSYAVSRFNKKSCELMTNAIPDLGQTFKEAYPGRLPGDNYNGEVGDFEHEYFGKLRKVDAVDKFIELNEHAIKFHRKDNPRRESPINDMITKMPEMVLKILNKSIMTTKYALLIEDLKSHDFSEGDIHRVIVDFGALEQFEEYDGKDRGNEEETGGSLKPNHYKYGSNPLQTMTKVHRDLDLLVHPVVEALIITKWERFARAFFYIFTFLFYLIFFGVLMAYQVFQITPYVLLENDTIFRSWIENSSHTCEEFPNGCFVEKPRPCLFLGYTLMALSSLRLFIEFFDILDHCHVEKSKKINKRFPNRLSAGCSLVFATIKCWFGGFFVYLSNPENYLEIVLYTSSLLFSLDVLDPHTAMTPIRWQVGTLSVLASFINLLLILQVFPKIGLYIIMFFKIAWTFLSNILILLMYFVVAFGVIFHMLLSHTSIFRFALSGNSIFKTLSAGVSGIEYDDYADQDLTFHIATLIGLIVFVLFVQVLFLNMATGLAIGDVEIIRDGAKKAMNAIKIKHIYDAERVLSALRWNVFEKRFQNMPAKKFKLKTIKDIEKLSAVN